MRHQGAGSIHDHIIGKSGRQNLFIKCLAGQGMWQFCSPMRYYCVQVQQVDGNADHVGPKLFETRTRIDAKQASATERSHVT
jgi:hypothetical protein